MNFARRASKRLSFSLTDATEPASQGSKRFSLPVVQAKELTTRASKRFSLVKVHEDREERAIRKAEAVEKKQKEKWRKCGHDIRVRAQNGTACQAPEGLCHWKYFDGSEEEKKRTLEHCTGCQRDLCRACIANGQL